MTIILGLLLLPLLLLLLTRESTCEVIPLHFKWMKKAGEEDNHRNDVAIVNQLSTRESPASPFYNWQIGVACHIKNYAKDCAFANAHSRDIFPSDPNYDPADSQVDLQFYTNKGGNKYVGAVVGKLVEAPSSSKRSSSRAGFFHLASISKQTSGEYIFQVTGSIVDHHYAHFNEDPGDHTQTSANADLLSLATSRLKKDQEGNERIIDVLYKCLFSGLYEKQNDIRVLWVEIRINRKAKKLITMYKKKGWTDAGKEENLGSRGRSAVRDYEEVVLRMHLPGKPGAGSSPTEKTLASGAPASSWLHDFDHKREKEVKFVVVKNELSNTASRPPTRTPSTQRPQT